MLLTPQQKQELDKKAAYYRIYEKYKDYTMIEARTYYDNLVVAEQASNVSGCVVECGVWRGGMIAGISELLGNNRHYYLFDSFEGLPEVKEIDGERAKEWQNNKESEHYFDNCKAEMDFAQKAMRMANRDKVSFVKGWFSDTLPQFNENTPIALLRLDCDWYDSVIVCLEKLFPMVAKNGVIVIDDYFTWDGCAIAVHDYLSKYKIPNRINSVDRRMAYIIK
jgi:O-methyltransferase